MQWNFEEVCVCKYEKWLHWRKHARRSFFQTFYMCVRLAVRTNMGWKCSEHSTQTESNTIHTQYAQCEEIVSIFLTLNCSWTICLQTRYTNKFEWSRLYRLPTMLLVCRNKVYVQAVPLSPTRVFLVLYIVKFAFFYVGSGLKLQSHTVSAPINKGTRARAQQNVL